MTTRASCLIAVLFLAASALFGAAQAPVDVITLKGSINPASAQFIVRAITAAETGGAQAIVIQLDTPGGLMDSMKDIVQKELAAKVPVVVYVAPSGAWAGSAGTFITMAAHIAAMSPGSNIGSAHPVGIRPPQGEGEKPSPDSKTMEEKAVNNAVAYIRSIAQERGRNADWGETAIRRSKNLPARDALKHNVVDLMASDLDDLLAKIDKRSVKTRAGAVVLKTKGAPIRTLEMSAREQFLHVLSNPNLLYILLLIAINGIIFELMNPGSILPGVLGGIALILALYSMAIIPINAAGIALIVLAVIFFIVDLNVPSHGALTAGGIISFVLGSFMIFDTGSDVFRVSAGLVIGGTAITSAFFVFLLRLAVKAQRNKIVSGLEGLVGKLGEARTDIAPTGRVFADGTYWNAVTEGEPIKTGESVKIVGMQGFKVIVTRGD